MAKSKVNLALHRRAKKKPTIKDKQHISVGIPGVGSMRVEGTRDFMNRSRRQWNALMAALFKEFKRVDPARANETGRKLADLSDIALKRIKAGERKVTLTEKDLRKK